MKATARRRRTIEARCKTCEVGVSGGPELVARWIVSHLGQAEELGREHLPDGRLLVHAPPHELQATAVEL